MPAVAGGIFGLLGGYLTDLFGRRRVLDLEHPALRVLGVRRRLFDVGLIGCCSGAAWTFVGVCVEFVAAVAWLSELFANPKQREAVVGYTQVVRIARRHHGRPAPTTWSSTYGEHLPAVRGGHEAWRYTLMSGVIPAIPLILIRPFLPESPTWREKKRPAR